MQAITYGQPSEGDVGANAANGSLASLTTAAGETDIYKITRPELLWKSQLSVYIDVILSAATSVKFRYYFSKDGGTNWFALPTKNLSSDLGELQDIPSVIDSGSPSQVISSTTHYKTVEDIAMSGANAFKVTATAVGGTTGALAVDAMIRDN